MRIGLVHNSYRVAGGEDVAVSALRDLLGRRGHEVVPLFRSSLEIPQGPIGSASAFLRGIYRMGARREAREMLDRRPDLIHVHNLYPLISPWILPEFRRGNIPVVMTVHNYRMICPNGLLMTGGMVCGKCLGGREYWCLLKKCEESIPKSAAYAIRGFLARRFRLFLDNVSVFIALTRFQKGVLTSHGFPPDRVVVIPQIAEAEAIRPGPPEEPPGQYVGYAGRFSPEKGIDLLLQVARESPDIPFRLAGDASRMPEARRRAPRNCEFLGVLDRAEMGRFYRSARVIVLPTRCYEVFPLSIVEAMACGKPVVTTRIGGLPEIVEDGVTGLLCEPGDAAGLRSAVVRLWEDAGRCSGLGSAGREKALRQYSPEACYGRLLEAYRLALRTPVRSRSD